MLGCSPERPTINGAVTAPSWRGHGSDGRGLVIDQFEIVGELGRGGMGVVYQALTGALPFEAQTIFELAARISAGAVRRPRAIDRKIPAALEAVCLRALSAAPAERYAHGQALADDLDRALRGEPVEARHPVSLRGWVRRSPWLLAPLAAVAAVGAVALLYDPCQAPELNPTSAIEESPADPRLQPEQGGDSKTDSDLTPDAWPDAEQEVSDRLPPGKTTEDQRGVYLGKNPKEAEFWRNAAIAKGWKPKRVGERERAPAPKRGG